MKTKLPLTTGTNGEQFKNKEDQTASVTVSKYSKEQLDAALLDSFDLMRRALLQNTYIVVGDAAKCLQENKKLDCDGLDFVIEIRHIKPQARSMIKDWVTQDVTDEGFTYFYGGVPLRFKFLKKNYDYFKYADMRFYGPEQYNIPNNWDEYWKHKDEIV